MKGPTRSLDVKLLLLAGPGPSNVVKQFPSSRSAGPFPAQTPAQSLPVNALQPLAIANSHSESGVPRHFFPHLAARSPIHVGKDGLNA